MFFDTWSGLGRVVVISACAYAALIVVLRISGKRTLGKMNAFDLAVTVAIGSTLATVLLSKDVALAEGILAFVRRGFSGPSRARRFGGIDLSDWSDRIRGCWSRTANIWTMPSPPSG